MGAPVNYRSSDNHRLIVAFLFVLFCVCFVLFYFLFVYSLVKK